MYRARCRGLYETQNALNEMWILCVVKKVPFASVAEHYKYSLDAMIRDGLNKNMMTRERWFDVPTVVKMGGFQVFVRLKMDSFQYRDLALSVSEMDSLGLRWNQIAERYGPEFCNDECERLGVRPAFIIQAPSASLFPSSPDLFIF